MEGEPALLETPAPEAPPPVRRLHRSATNKVVAGVCGGLGEYFGVDPVWFRIAFVALALGGWGGGLILYVVGWIALPEEAGAAAPVAVAGRAPAVVGAILIGVGALALLDRLVPWVDRVWLPFLVIAAGIALVWGGVHRDTAA